MISYISSWARGIVFALVIAGIIEIILPEGNNKKYIKTIIGIYIAFIVIYPIISKVSGGKTNIDRIINNTEKEVNSNYSYENSDSIDTNAYIEKTYKKKIEDDIENNMKQNGYILIDLALDIEEENEERYGEIKSINMIIEKKKEDNNREKNNKNNSKNGNEKNKTNINEKNYTNMNIDMIEEVRINTSKSNNTYNNKNNKEFNLSDDEIKSLKEFINTKYGTSIEQIHINE